MENGASAMNGEALIAASSRFMAATGKGRDALSSRPRRRGSRLCGRRDPFFEAAITGEPASTITQARTRRRRHCDQSSRACLPGHKGHFCGEGFTEQRTSRLRKCGYVSTLCPGTCLMPMQTFIEQ